MQKKMNKQDMKNQAKGFTLVELIVVMAILALLAALAVPKFADILVDARGSADVANVKLLQDAVDLYYAQEREYPVDLNGLKPDYIKEIPTPTDPSKTFVLNTEHEVIIQ